MAFTTAWCRPVTSETALSVSPSASMSHTKFRRATVTRWPVALKGTASMRVRPHAQAQRCLLTSTLVLSIPMGRCQRVTVASPCLSISPPQHGQTTGAASAATKAPGNVLTVTAVGQGFLDVPKFATSCASVGAPVCAKPSICDGTTRKPDEARPAPNSEATASWSGILAGSAWKMGGCSAATGATLGMVVVPFAEPCVVRDARF